MTNHFSNSRTYARRNAYAAAVQSLVRSFAKPEQRTTGLDLDADRVECTEFMFGFFLDCEGLDKKAEQDIVAEAISLCPRLRAETFRKTVRRPRYVKFSF